MSAISSKPSSLQQPPASGRRWAACSPGRKRSWWGSHPAHREPQRPACAACSYAVLPRFPAQPARLTLRASHLHPARRPWARNSLSARRAATAKRGLPLTPNSPAPANPAPQVPLHSRQRAATALGLAPSPLPPPLLSAPKPALVTTAHFFLLQVLAVTGNDAEVFYKANLLMTLRQVRKRTQQQQTGSRRGAPQRLLQSRSLHLSGPSLSPPLALRKASTPNPACPL